MFKKFFPNIETAIIAVFLLCVMLWGASRCRNKKTETTIANVSEVRPLSQSTIENQVTPSPVSTPSTPAASTPVIPPPPSAATPAATSSVPPPPSATPSSVPAVPTATPKGLAPPKPESYSTVPTPPKGATPSVNTKSVTPQNQGTPLVVLIDGLKLRSAPNLNAKLLGKLKADDTVYFLNERTDTPQTIRLADGTSVSKPWFKIKTKRGTIGWVHGSGVDFYKRKASDSF